uniref:Proteolipid protein 2 n=1 Tax=Equus caballus TaxID=9796 RepID=A0A9L0RHW8_HORSE
MHQTARCLLGTAQTGSGVLRRPRTSMTRRASTWSCPPACCAVDQPALPLRRQWHSPPGRASPALLVSGGGGNKMVRSSLDLPGALGPVLCLVILICFSASTSAYSSLSVIEMILAAIFFVIYMCDLHNKIQIINWPWSDFFRTLIAAILYLITSIVVLVNERNHSRITAGVLGLIATCLFGYDAYTTFPLRQQRHSAAPTDPADGPV